MLYIFVSYFVFLSVWLVGSVQALTPPTDVPVLHKLLTRQATYSSEDPCDCACGSLVQAGETCMQSGSTDIFCACPAFLESSSLCASCTGSDVINSTYQAYLPPFTLEIVKAFCACQDSCADVAPAFFVCPPGLEGLNCTCEILVTSYKEECSCCLKKADPWLESIVALFKSQCVAYLQTGVGKTFCCFNLLIFFLGAICL